MRWKLFAEDGAPITLSLGLATSRLLVTQEKSTLFVKALMIPWVIAQGLSFPKTVQLDLSSCPYLPSA